MYINISTNLIVFNEFRQHNNSLAVILTDHLPELFTGVLHGTLSDDKCLLFLVTLKII